MVNTLEIWVFIPKLQSNERIKMTERKYQIFVSSTYTDLKDERLHVLNAITGLKHLAAGMELFCASNDEQFKYIKRVIDDSDYYVLIIGARYGSINQTTGLSYTEMEFDYAVEKGIPILAFIKENAVEHATDSDKQALLKFINKVQNGRLVKYWSDLTTLQSSVYPALVEVFDTSPQQGWQRFQDKEDRTELLEEINKLRKENDDLKTQYKNVLSELNKETQIKDLADINDKIDIRYNYTHDYRNILASVISTTWISIFRLIGPHISAPVCSNVFKEIIRTRCVDPLTHEETHSVNDEDVQTIKYQLAAYGLIKVYTAQSKGAGPLEYIELTDKGRLELLKSKVVIKSKDTTDIQTKE